MFIYDSTKAGVWMIDFAKSTPVEGNGINHRLEWVMGNHEDGYLIGLDNLIRVCFLHLYFFIKASSDGFHISSFSKDNYFGVAFELLVTVYRFLMRWHHDLFRLYLGRKVDALLSYLPKIQLLAACFLYLYSWDRKLRTSAITGTSVSSLASSANTTVNVDVHLLIFFSFCLSSCLVPKKYCWLLFSNFFFKQICLLLSFSLQKFLLFLFFLFIFHLAIPYCGTKEKKLYLCN